MKLVCEQNKCTACGACVGMCPKQAIYIQDDIRSVNAVIDENRCVGCGLCEKVCQVCTPLPSKKPLKWVEGWSNNADIRQKSSSGGFATAMMISFLREGGVVYSCRLIDGHFSYTKATTEKEIFSFTGSKYVKSSPVGAYHLIRQDLQQGHKVLVVGLPCHIAGVQNSLSTKLKENLWTVDLICHGTPSEKLLEIFLQQHHSSLGEMDNILFRTKGKFQKYRKFYHPLREYGVTDSYSYAFLNGLTFTENCYSCPYADSRRISDVTIGDAWGTTLSQEEQEQGISLALCNTQKGLELLQRSDLHLEPADISRATAHNSQLCSPSPKHAFRNAFFGQIEAGRTVDRVINGHYISASIKMVIKFLLVRLRVIRQGTIYTILLPKEKS